MNCLLKEFAICVDVTEGLLLKNSMIFVCVHFFVGKIF